MSNQQTVDLGFIIRQFKDYDFSMNTSDDRIKLQNLIYLLQAYDIYLGYDFSWYIRGPFSIILSKCGLALERIYREVPKDEVWFDSKRVQERFTAFKSFIDGKIHDPGYLEMVASLHMLKASGMSDDESISHHMRKMTTINDTYLYNREYYRKILNHDVKPLLNKVEIISTFNENLIKLDQLFQMNMIWWILQAWITR